MSIFWPRLRDRAVGFCWLLAKVAYRTALVRVRIARRRGGRAIELSGGHAGWGCPAPRGLAALEVMRRGWAQKAGLSELGHCVQ